MAREIQSLYSLNRGIISPLGLARLDVKRLALAAQEQTNWMPRVLGPMSVRAGLLYMGGVRNNAKTKLLRHIFSTDDVSLLELTANTMRVWINDVLLTRPSVSTAILNDSFAASLANWTDYDEAGATSSWSSAGVMSLVGSGSANAIREQQVTCASAGIEHGIRITIIRGPVSLRIGSTSGGDEYVSETVLNTGTHSLSIVPTGDFYIRFFSVLAREVLVGPCTIEPAGVVAVPTPWGESDFNNLRYDQSGDVLFVACAGKRQYRIERRGTRPAARGFSVVGYYANDGPFQVQNISPLTLTPSAISGNIVIASSAALFKAKHVGSLISMTSTGQQVAVVAAASSVATASIRVTGIAEDRTFSIIISGDATGSTVDLQRSYDNATWANVGGVFRYTADITDSCTDGLNNQIVYYRLILTTRVAPDSVTLALSIGSGSVRGVVRVLSYVSPTAITAEVLTNLGGTGSTKVWQLGSWSDVAGWPTSVRIHEGRLWWFGKNGVWGSISDAYDSFDETFLGDAAPINRTIGSGPVDTINWGLSLKGLLVGAQGAEFTARASSLDDPLTPTNFNLKVSTTQGSGAVDAIKVDQSGYFVNRSNTKVYDLSFDLKSYDYGSTDLMELAPEIALAGIVRMDCQRLPDTRLHCVLADGRALVCAKNKAEDVLAWVPIETTGFIEDVAVLPAKSGDLDDQVYYVVRRTINGSTVRYLEKWAQEIDCRGGTLNKQADAAVIYSGSTTNVISGLDHLEGQAVVVWADGKDVGTNDSVVPWVQKYTVSGGKITMDVAVSNAVIGLGYSARFKSAKLGTATQITPLNQQKAIGHIGLILAYTHPRGVKFGPTFEAMDDMPLISDGAMAGDDTQEEYDQNLIEFPRTWTTDARICLLGQAPRPCTVLAVTPDIARNS